MSGQRAAAAVTVEAILSRLETRALDIQQRNERDAARFTSPEDRYARGLAEGHADAAGLILAEVERIRREVRR